LHGNGVGLGLAKWVEKKDAWQDKPEANLLKDTFQVKNYNQNIWVGPANLMIFRQYQSVSGYDSGFCIDLPRILMLSETRPAHSGWPMQ
jgi:hypothetical protein